MSQVTLALASAVANLASAVNHLAAVAANENSLRVFAIFPDDQAGNAETVPAAVETAPAVEAAIEAAAVEKSPKEKVLEALKSPKFIKRKLGTLAKAAGLDEDATEELLEDEFAVTRSVGRRGTVFYALDSRLNGSSGDDSDDDGYDD